MSVPGNIYQLLICPGETPHEQPDVELWNEQLSRHSEGKLIRVELLRCDNRFMRIGEIQN
jgi:hypothetical protein